VWRISLLCVALAGLAGATLFAPYWTYTTPNDVVQASGWQMLVAAGHVTQLSVPSSGIYAGVPACPSTDSWLGSSGPCGAGPFFLAPSFVLAICLLSLYAGAALTLGQTLSLVRYALLTLSIVAWTVLWVRVARFPLPRSASLTLDLGFGLLGGVILCLILLGFSDVRT
jgi:hypothetical protein